jgi:flagellar hook-associated protein 1 FlgK
MISLFGTLDMGARSLGVQQEEMTVSGQNLANVNNSAYAEEQLEVSESTPDESSIGDEGTGVQITGITEIRDPFLDTQIQGEASTTGSLTAQQTNLQNAEAYLDEQISSTTSSNTPDSANGLAADLSSMFAAFQGLTTDPSNLSLRTTATNAAQTVATQFTTVSGQLTNIQNGLNTSIKNDVATANQDLTTIASLNQQIVEAQNSGGSAVQLVDQREQTLESLAGVANFTTSAQANGAVNVSIGGITMVSGINVTDGLQAYDPGTGNLMVEDTNSSAPITLTGGSIAGEITARDGALAGLQSGLNTLASQLITNVNSIYSTGYDLNGNTGQDFFTGTDASNIAVNSTVLSDPSSFQASSEAGDAGNDSIALSLAKLGNQAIAGLGNQTFSSNYAQTVSDLGTSISTVNDNLSASQAVSQMLTTQRANTSGVSLDGEMTNLIEYQKAYEASAELITTVNEMLQTVVNMKTS